MNLSDSDLAMIAKSIGAAPPAPAPKASKAEPPPAPAAPMVKPPQASLELTASDKFWAGARVVSSAASLVHGYRRNNSLGWGLWWFVWGALLPVVTPAVAVAQGYGQPPKK